MKTLVRDNVQTMQRVKVGLVGLAAVLLLIGLAATLFTIVSRERPNNAVGAPKADVVANLAASNSSSSDDAATSEPMPLTVSDGAPGYESPAASADSRERVLVVLESALEDDGARIVAQMGVAPAPAASPTSSKP